MRATTELIARVALAWMNKRPFSKEAKARRKARRAAKKSGQAIPAAQVEVSSMFPKGTQTLSGIAVLVLVPWLAKYGISSEQVATLVAAAATIGGTVVAVFGYLRRKKMPAE